MRFVLYQNAAQWLDPENSIRKIETGLMPAEFNLRPGDCLILPEMFGTGFVTAPAPWSDKEQTIKNQEYTLNWMIRFSGQLGVTILGSMPYLDGALLYNRMYAVDAGTKNPIFYNKRHLFGIAGEKDHYTAGDRRIILQKEGWRINLCICYDLRFPVWLRNKGDYDILVCIANWPVTRELAWKSLLIARAIENQCYVVGVNRVGTDATGTVYAGGSLAVGPDGTLLAEMNHLEGLQFFEPDAHFLQKYRRAYPFLGDADNFSVIC
jgi:predicted amidohydrolase